MNPALTQEEWAKVHGPAWSRVCDLDRLSDHAAAAVLLEGQPFGFTRDDVRNLRLSVADGTTIEPQPGGVPYARELWDLADRIEMLLPPEGT